MATAAPSKSTGGAAGHSRGDQTSRCLLASFFRFFLVLICLIFDSWFRTSENRKPRLTSLWPEWNEADVNAESWDIGSGKKKEAAAAKARTDTKSASSVVRNKTKTKRSDENEFLFC
jgi:hypothetical protein